MKSPLFLVLGACLVCATATQGAYLVLIDTDGADDGPITYNSSFSFGGDTTTASTSAAGSAFGLGPHDSIFGGDGTAEPDTYVYTYSPGVDADNLAIPAGTDLGEGDLASGLTGGTIGLYSVYATWPFTTNVSGGPTTYTATTTGDSFSIAVNQNDVTLGEIDGRGDVWVKLGEINYTGGDITLTQQSGINSFVSMRASAAMFEKIPEPSSTLLLLIGGFGLFRRSRAANS